MTRKPITAIIAITTALTFSSCKSADSSQSTAEESKSAISSSASEESSSVGDSSEDVSESLADVESSAENSGTESSTESKSADKTSDKESDKSAKNSKSGENPDDVTIITDDTKSNDEMPIIPADNGDGTSQDNNIILADESSAREDTSSAYEIDFSGDEVELPIVAIEP
ncbi:MAG: hypothetical protein K6F71_14380 [Ruminococcus sp.]|uniref:hypothetical protein n=1 Tax=Ruminococcus sp. TaxID=41978 RepID=UPI0025ECA7D4|nr:hypothetical protein [Ruminococcus sp.]MCR5541990.1 hypothetical protein [Ruminococcus sp.]